MDFDIVTRPELPLIDRLFSTMDINETELKELTNISIDPLVSNADCLTIAKERIELAKSRHEKVFVAGDYDADGIMATTIIKSMLDELSIANGYYIPNRFKDGYGLSPKIVQMAFDKGYRLIITVDNGIKALDALALASQLGIDVIVTDHHQYDLEIAAFCVIHPSLLESQYAYFSGAAVALLLARQFMDDKRHIIFAMVATIGDQMILLRANRFLVKLGLEYLNESHYRSVYLLLNTKNMIDERDIGFQLVPKINALGRLEDDSNVNVLVSYFLSNNEAELVFLKDQINERNELRKKMSQAMVELGMTLVGNDQLVLIDDASFHEGMCGLAAGSIAKRVNRPTIVLSHRDGVLKGSGRSVEGFDLYTYLKRFEFLFSTFGGHAMAVGLSLTQDNYLKLQQFMKDEPLDIKITNERVVEVYPQELTIENLTLLNQYKPFGQGFKLPYLYMAKQAVVQSMLIKGKYPKWIISKNPLLEAISFDSCETLIEAPKYWVFEPQINQFNGKQSVSMLVKKVG